MKPVTSLIHSVSPQCQQAIISLAVPSSNISQCLQLPALLPAIMTNGSVIPSVDQYLSTVCSAPSCSEMDLNSTAAAIIAGCSAELEMFNVSNQTVLDAMSYYPLAREIACLKTNETDSLMNATIPLNSSAYNTTNGTFCVTSLATDLSAYLGVNLTNSYIDTVALGGNGSALRALSAIPPTALCTDCIFAAVELINEEVPQFANWTIPSTNFTINSFLNGTCTDMSYNLTDGTLPEGIFDGASNSTLNSTAPANMTMSILPIPASTASMVSDMPAPSAAEVSAPASMGADMPTPSAAEVSAPAVSAAGDLPASAASAVASATQALVGRMAEKKRWFGQA